MAEPTDNFRDSVHEMNRHLTAPFSKDEEKLVREWLQRKREQGECNDQTPDPASLQSIGAEIYRKLDEEVNFSGKSPWSGKRAFLKIAASILLLMATGLGWYLSQKSRNQFTLIENPSGNIKQVNLADGSRVWLNGSVRLKISNRFNDRVREVHLEGGEVFFSVQRNEQKPFIVHTPNLTVRVLGTSFNIKAYPQLLNTRITVAGGTVRVSKQDETLDVLKKDDELVFNKEDLSYHTRTTISEKVASWRKGDIYLQDVPFDELIIALNNRYDVHITYPRSLDQQKISIHLFRHQSLDEVFGIITAIYGITYKTEGKEVKISLNST